MDLSSFILVDAVTGTLLEPNEILLVNTPDLSKEQVEILVHGSDSEIIALANRVGFQLKDAVDDHYINNIVG